MSTRKRRKSRRQRQREARQRRIMMGIVCLALIIAVVVGIRGCQGGIKNGSSTQVVRSLIQAYEKKQENKIKACYGQKEAADESLMQEMQTKLRFLQAQNPKEIKILSCDVLGEAQDYTGVYIQYNIVLENEQEYPCLETYLVRQNEKIYEILSPAEITEDMSLQTADWYVKFMTTDIYKNFMKEYNTFSKKNPGYEERISEILGA